MHPLRKIELLSVQQDVGFGNLAIKALSQKGVHTLMAMSVQMLLNIARGSLSQCLEKKESESEHDVNPCTYNNS